MLVKEGFVEKKWVLTFNKRRMIDKRQEFTNPEFQYLTTEKQAPTIKVQVFEQRFKTRPYHVDLTDDNKSKQHKSIHVHRAEH